MKLHIFTCLPVHRLLVQIANYCARLWSFVLMICLFVFAGQAQTTTNSTVDKIRVENGQNKTNRSTDNTESKSKNVEVEIGASAEHLSNNFAPWREAYISVSKKFKSKQAVYGIYRETSRQNQRDRELTGGFYQPVAKNTTVFIEASASPTHRILPKFSTLLQIEQSLKKGWAVHGGWRHTLKFK